jgi:hypothetical protein
VSLEKGFSVSRRVLYPLFRPQAPLRTADREGA